MTIKFANEIYNCLLVYLIVLFNDGAFWFPHTVINYWLILGFGHVAYKINDDTIIREEKYK